MVAFPKISFGIIVLNGEPFTRYCLRQLYPHAHEIIVVEGGSKKAIDEAPDGHSLDGTLEILREFKATEDPEGKLQIVTKDGFWSEKDEQSQAYAERATGDYLWQVDIDEFYKHEDIEKVRGLLAREPIDTMSFRQVAFWGSLNVTVDGFYLRAENASQFHRLFRWGKGSRYVTHRPPTVVNGQGMNLRSLRWLNAEDTEQLGIILYHYSLLFPKQVLNKCSYYAKAGPTPNSGGFYHNADKWAQRNYLHLSHPFRVHNIYKRISWLCHFNGGHPEEVPNMMRDIQNKQLNITLRDNSDADELLSRLSYRMAATALTSWSNLWRKPVFRVALKTYQHLGGGIQRILRLFD